MNHRSIFVLAFAGVVACVDAPAQQLPVGFDDAAGSSVPGPRDASIAPDATPSSADAAPSPADAAANDDASAPDAAVVVAHGTIPLSLTSEQPQIGAVVSLGVPFPPGVLTDLTMIRVLDASKNEVPAYVVLLAYWPIDRSIRSVLVAFPASIGGGVEWAIEYGVPRTLRSPPVPPAPDGPIIATLPATWLASSRVSGMQLPAAQNAQFARYDIQLERALVDMMPPYESYTVNCGTTNAHRTYYDGPHAMFTRYVRQGDAASYRRARVESVLYRASELTFYEGRTMAVHVCQAMDWTPDVPLAWGVMRRMTGQGMLDDYLLTGDTDARDAVLAMGEAFRRNLPALRGGRENTLRVTERNLAWTMMGVAAAYAANPSDDLRAALVSLVDEAVSWQAASGAFEHDIVRPDPTECSEGPSGGSPFMTSLLIDALMDAYGLLGDARIPGVVRGAARWLRDTAITSDGRAFRYLWNCVSDPYDDSGTADLNLLIVHVFGAAAFLTGDATWLDTGDHIAEIGIEEMYAGRPKQWNQAGRSFGRYLGYRATLRSP